MTDIYLKVNGASAAGEIWHNTDGQLGAHLDIFSTTKSSLTCGPFYSVEERAAVEWIREQAKRFGFASDDAPVSLIDPELD